jgi:hypothetical protein
MKTQCPECKTIFNVPDIYENKTTKCLKCSYSFIAVKKTGRSKISVLSIEGSVVLIAAGLIWLLVVPAIQKSKEAANIEVKANISPQSQSIIATATKPESNSPQTPKTEEEKIDALKAKPFLMSSEEKAARDNILKDLLDISSATAIGVNRDRYGDLLTKALSTLTFEKTKLSTERHLKFLLCASKAIDYYAKANNQWSDYFKYDWMRERKEALMSQFDFDDFRENGLTVNASNYHKYEKDTGYFFVPFNECLSMYWQVADIYVEKMKEE